MTRLSEKRLTPEQWAVVKRIIAEHPPVKVACPDEDGVLRRRFDARQPENQPENRAHS